MPLLELADRSTDEAMVEPTEAPVDVVEDLRGPPYKRSYPNTSTIETSKLHNDLRSSFFAQLKKG